MQATNGSTPGSTFGADNNAVVGKMSDGWLRVPVRHIEDLGDAIYGAGLSAMQMTSAPVTGSLLFREHNGITYSSGRLNGRVSLVGPLSEHMVTFGVGIVLAPGTRHWLREVESGDVGLFMAGDEHNALYSAGSMYAAVTMPEVRAEEIASQACRVLNVRKLGGSGVHPKGVGGPALANLQRRFSEMHAGHDDTDICELLLESVMEHFGRLPRPQIGSAEYRGYSRLVRRGQRYIDSNLSRPISVNAVATAIGTSSRTLFRAFDAILGETPLGHIQRLRLHRIRRDLLAGGGRSIGDIATGWGMGELGRFSNSYRVLFGELPSQTRATNLRRSGVNREPKLARFA